MNYVLLQTLKSMVDGGPDDERWLENLRRSGVDGDFDVTAADVDGDIEYYDGNEEALVRVEEARYINFMGDSGGNDERFFEAGVAVYMASDGRLYAEECDEIFEF